MDRVLFCDERNSEWKWHIIRRGWHWWSVRLVTPLMPRPHPRTPRCKSLMFFPSPWLHQVINYTEWSVISHRCFNGVRETGRLRALLKYNVYGWMWLYSFSNKSYILKNTILFGVFLLRCRFVCIACKGISQLYRDTVGLKLYSYRKLAIMKNQFCTLSSISVHYFISSQWL